MAFRLGDITIDRIAYGYAEDINDATPLYVLSQVSEASIEVTAESTDKLDKDGNLVHKIYKSKTGTLTATNAFISTAIMQAASGNEAKIGALTKVPRIITLPANGEAVELPGYTDGANIQVAELTGDGSLGQKFVKAEAAAAEGFKYAIATAEDKVKITVPKIDGMQVLVKYERAVEDGMEIKNTVNAFPKSVKLTLKAFYYDPCDKAKVKSCYVVIPSFKPSPDVSISLTTDTTMDYTGDLEYDYCGCGKTLYKIYFVDDNEELTDDDFCID